MNIESLKIVENYKLKKIASTENSVIKKQAIV